MSPKSHSMLWFSSASRYLIQVTESLSSKIWRSSDFVRSYESINVFVFSSFYCNNVLLYTVQAVSSKITQISIDNHLYSLRKVIQSEISKIEIKSEECAQEISSCFICFTQDMKVVTNCRKPDILKGKQVVSLVKRFSKKFFQCLQSSPPASTCSLQLPFVYIFLYVSFLVSFSVSFLFSTHTSISGDLLQKCILAISLHMKEIKNRGAHLSGISPQTIRVTF